MNSSEALPPGVSFHNMGEGALGALVRAKDWRQTPIGARESWPRTLQGYVSMILTLPTPAIIFWGEQQTQIYNDGYAVIMGPRHPQFLGGSYRDCWPDTYPTIYPWMRRVLDQGEVVRVERTPIPLTRYGFTEEAFFTFSFTPLRDDEGSIAGFLQLVTEVTSSVLAERRLKTLQALVPKAKPVNQQIESLIIEPLSKNPEDIRCVLLFLPSSQGQLLSLAGSFGVDPAGAQADDLRRLVEQVYRTNQPVKVDQLQSILPHIPIAPWAEPTESAWILPIRRSEAETPLGVILLGISPRLQFDDLYRQFFQAIARDLEVVLTTRQEVLTQQEVARERERLFAIFQQAPVAVSVMEGAEHRISLYNAYYRALIGDQRELLGRTVSEALPEIVEQGFIKMLDQVYRTGELFEGTEIPSYIVHPDGSRRHLYVNLIYQPKRNRQGEVDGIVAVSTDVTELVESRKRIEDIATELKEKEEGLKLALRGGDMGAWSFDFRSQILKSDARFRELHRVQEHEDLSEAVERMVHPDDRELLQGSLWKAVEQGTVFSCEYRVLDSKGGYRWLYARGEAKGDGQDQDRAILAGVAFDISERKFVEEKLAAREAEFRSMADSIPQLAWIADASGWVYWYNQRWFEYTGTTLEEMQGMGWLNVHHPDNAEQVKKFVAEASQEGLPWEMTYPLRSRNGEWRWFLTRVVPILDEQGKVVRWFGTNTDVHDQKEAESALRKLNSELEEFAYVSSHDLQEPLRKVTLYTQLLLNDLRSDNLADLELYSGYIQSGVRRMQSLIQDLLAYSRTVHHESDIDSQEADLQLAFADAMTLLDQALSEHQAEVRAEELPRVQADQGQMSQVFQNLLSNALKYQPPGQQPKIRIRVQREGDSWVIRVEDNGVGFAPEYADKIFWLFKRLYKDEYPGTGLGLAICRRIVERYQGQIWAESPGEGQGACFSMRLKAVV